AMPIVEITKHISKPQEKKDEKPADEPVVMPAFVPARMKPGEGLLEVTTRQRFINDGIKTWLEWHYTRAFAILFAVAALFALQINLFLSIALGAIAGFSYGHHWKAARRINIFYTRRRLLYTR
ncbi:hypothetical protein HY571_00440, partial [Candidatus Micrarchaeota archaeon]|nr:hypothetical protein [Candidatus Micrarchaeota archaeon]